MSPMLDLKSRIVVCESSQNIASSTDWKSSRTACALGGVSKSSGKFAPLQHTASAQSGRAVGVRGGEGAL